MAICSVNETTIKNGIINDVVSVLLTTGRFAKQGNTLVKVIDPFKDLEKSINGLDETTQQDLRLLVDPSVSKTQYPLPEQEIQKLYTWLEQQFPNANTTKALAENLDEDNLPDTVDGVRLRNEGITVESVSDSLNNEGIYSSVKALSRQALPDYVYGSVTTKDVVDNRNEDIDNKLDDIFGLKSLLNDINNSYGEEVVTEQQDTVTINPSDSLVQEYLETYKGDQESDKIIDRVMNITIPAVSPTQSRKINLLLEQMGVQVENISNITINGQQISEDGVALPLQALVGYTEGQEQVLPEEAFHIAIEILSQKHPGLLNQMMSAITSFPIYKEVYDTYSQNSLYQQNGKPDIIKLKKEAIAKQLAITFEQDSKVKSWWQKVLSYLKEWFTNANVNVRPFSDTLKTLFTTDIGSVRENLLQSRRYLRSKGISEENIDQIVELAASPLSNDELRLHLEQIVPTEAYFAISDKTKNTYNRLKDASFEPGDYNDFLGSVTASVRAIFGEETLDIAENLIDQFKNKDKVALREDINNILSRYINNDGSLRTSPLAFSTAKTGRESYDALEERITDKLNQFKDGKFIVNKEIASAKTGFKGKVDLLTIDGEGRASIIQFLPATYVRTDKNFIKVTQDYLKAIQSTLSEGYKVQTTQVRTIPLPIESGSIEGTIDEEMFPELTGTVDKTGVVKIDALIGRLNSVLSKTSRGVGDERIASQIVKAVRQIQVKGSSEKLALAVNSVSNRIQGLLLEYEDEFEKNDRGGDILLEDKTEEEVTLMANKINHAMELAVNLQNLYSTLNQAHKENPAVYEEPKKSLKRAESNLNSLMNSLRDKNEDFLDRFVSKSVDVENILTPERPVSWINKTFKTIYEPMTRATKVLATMWQRMNRLVDSKTDDEIKQVISKIRDDYDRMFKASGRSLKDGYLSFISKKDAKGNYVHELLSKYNRNKFEDGLKTAIDNNDMAWIDKNVDVQAYNTWYETTRQQIEQDYRNIVYHSDPDTNEEIIQNKIDSWVETYSIEQSVSKFNNKLKDYITDNFLSTEYKELSKNKPAFALYNYILDMNHRAYAQGVISKEQADRIIPAVEKKLLDKAIQGGRLSVSPNLLKGLVSPEEYAELNRRDPETGRREERIPFYYISDLSTTRKDGTKDYSNVSQDIFSVLPLYAKQTFMAEEIRKKEAQLRLLGLLEKNKVMLTTNKFNEADPTGGVVSGRQNFDYYQNYLSGSIYGNRMIDDSDIRIAKISNKATTWLNKNFGLNIENSEASGSLNGFVQTMNKLFQLKVLGGNVMIPLANFVGSNAQALINTNSREFTKRELVKNEWEAMTDKFKSEEERKAYHGLADYFQLLYNGVNVERAARKMSLSKLTQRTIPEYLMSLQEYSEIPVQLAIGMSMLDNNMVVDGRIVKIYDHVSAKYPQYLEVSQSERNDIDKKIAQEIEQLKKTSSIRAVATINNDQITIPGIEKNSAEVFDFIGRVHATVRKATGGGTKESFRQANQNIWLGSMMVFKSWLPRLLENRIGVFKYNQGLQSYEIGRYNAIVQIASVKWRNSLQRLYDVATMNDRGVDILKEQYEDHKIRYEERTGEEFKITQREYVLMYRDLVNSSMKDAMFFASFLGLVAGIGAIGGDDDDDTQRSGAYKFITNLTTRFYKEMSLFYNPMEMYKIFDGGVFPALGVVREFLTIGKEVGNTIDYMVTNDEELEKKTHLFKALTKPFPMSSMLNMYMPIFAEEYAKELGFQPPRLN